MTTISTTPDEIRVSFENGVDACIGLAAIQSIDIEVIPTMGADVDCIRLGHGDGKYLEVMDDADGFETLGESLSERFRISPAIPLRFARLAAPECVYLA